MELRGPQTNEYLPKNRVNLGAVNKSSDKQLKALKLVRILQRLDRNTKVKEISLIQQEHYIDIDRRLEIVINMINQANHSIFKILFLEYSNFL